MTAKIIGVGLVDLHNSLYGFCHHYNLHTFIK